MKIDVLANSKQRQEIKPHIHTQLIFTSIPRKHNGKSLFDNGAMNENWKSTRQKGEMSLYLSFIQESIHN